MFYSPYATTNGSLHNLSKLQKQLEVSKATGLLTPCRHPEVNRLFFILPSPETKTIPQAQLPVTMVDSHRKEEWYVVADLRPYVSYLQRSIDSNGQFKVPDQGPVALLFKQALLQMIWQKGESGRLFSATDFPILIYATWISEALQRHFGLNPHVQSEVRALAGWFYMCLFFDAVDKAELESEMSSKIIKLARVLQIDVSSIHELIKRVGYLANLSELIAAIKELGDPRASQLNPGVFFTVLSRGWFGHANDPYMVSAALEFPPFFMAYVYVAATETNFKNQPIASTALRFNRNNRLEEYRRVMDGFFQSALTGSN